MGLDVFGIFKNSFQILFNNKTVITLAVINGLLGALLYLMLPQQSAFGAYSQTPQFSLASLVGIIVFVLISIFVEGSILSAVATKSSLGEALNRAGGRYISLLGTSILTGIILVVPAILIIVPSALFSLGVLSGGGSPLLVGVMVILVLVGVVAIALFSIRLCIATVECVVGNNRAADSVRSSWSDTKGNFWGMFLTLLLISIATGIIGGVFEFIFSTVGVSVVGSFLSSFISTISTVALVLIYQGLGIQGSSTASPSAEKKSKAKSK
jgi:membrane-anchored glycerophosphoryl diester phosphodiesterase (GDPDase)